MKTSPDLLNIAMMLEARALDLYMRYSEKLFDETGKDLLYGLAERKRATRQAKSFPAKEEDL